jgi:hypothetical protein
MRIHYHEDNYNSCKLLATVSLAAAYTPEQQATVDGVRLSFQLGQSYDKATQGQDVPVFNVLVDQCNAWVVKNFGMTLLCSWQR